MLQTETTEVQRVACTFLRATLDGQLLPELIPQMGPWQEVGRILFQALANDGVQTARRIYTAMSKHDPRLITLVSADPPALPTAPAAAAPPTPAPAQQMPAVAQTPTTRSVELCTAGSPRGKVDSTAPGPTRTARLVLR